MCSRCILQPQLYGDLAIYWGNGTLLINKYKYFIWVPIDINVVCSRSSRSSAQSESVNIDKHFCMCKYIRSFDWTKVDKKILGGTLKILEKKQISSTDVSRKHTRMIPLSLTSHRTSTPSVIYQGVYFPCERLTNIKDAHSKISICLVLLFHGISTLVGNLMPNPTAPPPR